MESKVRVKKSRGENPGIKEKKLSSVYTIFIALVELVYSRGAYIN